MATKSVSRVLVEIATAGLLQRLSSNKSSTDRICALLITLIASQIGTKFSLYAFMTLQLLASQTTSHWMPPQNDGYMKGEASL